MPTVVMNTTIDQAHSPHYAVGYMFDKIQPRLAIVTHTSYDEEMIPEIVAGIRVHYSGLFQFGAPDIVVVNVTKDAVWTRKAAIPDAGNMARPSPRDAVDLFDLTPANLEVNFPNPRHPVVDIQEQDVRDREIDPKQYYPPDLYREPNRTFRTASRSMSAKWLSFRPKRPRPAHGKGRPTPGRDRRHRSGQVVLAMDHDITLTPGRFRKRGVLAATQQPPRMRCP